MSGQIPVRCLHVPRSPVLDGSCILVSYVQIFGAEFYVADQERDSPRPHLVERAFLPRSVAVFQESVFVSLRQAADGVFLVCVQIFVYREIIQLPFFCFIILRRSVQRDDVFLSCRGPDCVDADDYVVGFLF